MRIGALVAPKGAKKAETIVASSGRIQLDGLKLDMSHVTTGRRRDPVLEAMLRAHPDANAFINRLDDDVKVMGYTLIQYDPATDRISYRDNYGLSTTISYDQLKSIYT